MVFMYTYFPEDGGEKRIGGFECVPFHVNKSSEGHIYKKKKKVIKTNNTPLSNY